MQRNDRFHLHYPDFQEIHLVSWDQELKQKQQQQNSLKLPLEDNSRKISIILAVKGTHLRVTNLKRRVYFFSELRLEKIAVKITNMINLVY